jgi:hypothetical protein
MLWLTISSHTRLSSNTGGDDYNIRTSKSLLEARIFRKIPKDFGPGVDVVQICGNTGNMD